MRLVHPGRLVVRASAVAVAATLATGACVPLSPAAGAIGAPAAVRAVGAANGANPLAIIVPCHRVIGASGKLVGYGGGLALKKRLLEFEHHAVHGRDQLF